MQQFEKKRYEDALKAFVSAFAEGLSRGASAVAAALVSPIDNKSFPIRIDVPRADIIDGEWQRHVPRFSQAGFEGARYTRRRGVIALDAEVSSPELRENRVVCPWFIVDLG